MMRYAMSRRGALAGLAAALVTRGASAEIVDYVVIGKDGWLFAIYDEVNRLDANRLHAVTASINDAVAIMKAAGIETVITLTPAKSRIYRDYLPRDFQFTPDADRRYAMARDLLAKPGTLVPDLATLMLGLRKAHPDVAYFLKADTHWTGEGAEACAAEVASQINALHRPARTVAPQIRAVISSQQASNDLADGLPDARAAKYGPQTYQIHQAAPAAGLLDDDAADVLLVGNSYMQPKYGFASMLSNQLGRPVSLVWKVHQSSPYKTLVGALRSGAFQTVRPKLLVWDFTETDMTAPMDLGDVWGANAIKPEAFLAQLRNAVSA